MCTSVYRMCIKTRGRKASGINFIKLYGYFGILLSLFLDCMGVWMVLHAADALILFVMLLACIFCVSFLVCVFQQIFIPVEVAL